MDKIERARCSTLEGAKSYVTHEVYRTALIFERLEDEGLIKGNGHHLAQRLAAEAERLLEESWQEKKDNL
jgi:hypothetical protein